MQIDLSSVIDQLKDIQKKFNASESPTERYALLQSLNFIAEHQLKYDDEHWVMEQHRQGMLREQGIDPTRKRGKG